MGHTATRFIADGASLERTIRLAVFAIPSSGTGAPVNFTSFRIKVQSSYTGLSIGLRRVIAGVLVGGIAALVGSVITARGLPPGIRGTFLEIVTVAQIASFLSISGFILPVTSLAHGSVAHARTLMGQSSKYVVGLTAAFTVASIIVSVALVAQFGIPAWEVALAVGTLELVTAIERWMLIEVRVAEDFATLGVCAALPSVATALALLIAQGLGELTLMGAIVATALGPVATLAFVLTVWRGSRRERFSEVSMGRDETGSRRLVEISDARLLRLVGSDLATFGPNVLSDRVELLVVATTISPAAASVLAVARSVTNPLSLVGATIQTFFGPRLAAARVAERPSLSARAERQVLLASSAIAAAAVVAGIFLVPLVFGAIYSDAVIPSAVLAVGVVLGLGALVSSVVLRVEFHYRTVIVTAYSALALLVLAGAWVASRSGLTGFACVSSMISAAVFFYLRKAAARLEGAVTES